MIPPKPKPRADRVSMWTYLRLFRRDILSAQPARLYRAWMAEFRTPFFRSYLCNDPKLIRRVLDERPADFPKSDRVTEGLRPLLGRSVFVTNGEEWLHQRRIIDPAFEGGRVKEAFPAIWAAAEAAVARMVPGEVEVELAASHAAADVIFRTLFSIPIEDHIAQAVFHEFRAYQRSAPILNLAAFLPLPRWFPRLHRRATRASARVIRGLIIALTAERAAAIAAGTAPMDLATKIMTTPDPVTGQPFETGEMVDQVAIFFLAGHETSASALAWALYLLATHPEAQERVAAESAGLRAEFGVVGSLRFTRDAFREALRLYPPVPMMVRQNRMAEDFRGRMVKPGAQVVISPWHLHRHERIWERPDEFDPDRWATDAGGEASREGFLPFSRGPRVCPGAGFAMLEGTLMLAHLVRAFRFKALAGREPVPTAHLTVRAKDGIWLQVTRREGTGAP
ncbi:MAG: cytochrome P450 [Tabrizicola sp.]|nr:cytochrome P450 [Tabrizicola sp.]